MDKPPAKPSVPEELQTVMDAEFGFVNLKSVNCLIDLQVTLTEKKGIVTVEFVGEKLAVRYDPEEITGGEIRDSIRQAGFELAAAESGPPTPPIDSSERG
ncbi:MAG TPA: hypothetical protein VGM54_26875 [Chthoniobacter sp.]|jgi:hypothetical protein